MFNKILVCLDGSKLAEQILPLAEAQALQFKSKVVLLQVVDVPELSVVEAGAVYQDVKARDEQVQQNYVKAKAYLEKISSLLRAKEIPVETTMVRETSVGKAIIDYAEHNRIDLIAIATHGHGGLGQLVFGSVAEYVLRESGLPMLVIRPKNM
jgi:nucleotide-binding universal stress UspA family protein